MFELDLLRIKKALEGLAEPLELRIHTSPHRTVLNEQFIEAAFQIEQATSGSVRVVKVDGKRREHLPALPAMSLYWRGKSNIHYLAIPQGPEVLPFIEALIELPRGAAGHTERWTKLLAGKRRRSDVYVFVHPACTNCPAAVRAALKLSQVSREVHTSIIDVERFDKLVRRYNVRVVPTTVLDGSWTHVGPVQPGRLAELISRADSVGVRQQVFDSMVDAGRLDDAASWLLRNGSACFAGAWKKAGLQQRMALMLIAEKALMQRQDALAEAVPLLIEYIEEAESGAKGDTADLLGIIGDARAVGAIRRLLSDGDPEVVEVARDVLKNLPDA
ncbi:MAG: hypothetical protein D6806_12520 [Deltaproteobacteria bacterium]|nr:MAG: hypothetical protein D6806_12520 [Deltaproteobacteria bacterium]